MLHRLSQDRYQGSYAEIIWDFLSPAITNYMLQFIFGISLPLYQSLALIRTSDLREYSMKVLSFSKRPLQRWQNMSSNVPNSWWGKNPSWHSPFKKLPIYCTYKYNGYYSVRTYSTSLHSSLNLNLNLNLNSSSLWG